MRAPVKLIVSAAAATALLTGCVVYPDPYASGYGYAPSYLGDEGYYGSVPIAAGYSPTVWNTSPVIVYGSALSAAPIYMRVPEMHRLNWSTYCGYYSACAVPVFFLEDVWYSTIFAPAYRHAHPHGRPMGHYRPMPGGPGMGHPGMGRPGPGMNPGRGPGMNPGMGRAGPGTNPGMRPGMNPAMGMRPGMGAGAGRPGMDRPGAMAGRPMPAGGPGRMGSAPMGVPGAGAPRMAGPSMGGVPHGAPSMGGAPHGGPQGGVPRGGGRGGERGGRGGPDRRF